MGLGSAVSIMVVLFAGSAVGPVRRRIIGGPKLIMRRLAVMLVNVTAVGDFNRQATMGQAIITNTGLRRSGAMSLVAGCR